MASGGVTLAARHWNTHKDEAIVFSVGHGESAIVIASPDRRQLHRFLVLMLAPHCCFSSNLRIGA
jgi:hypothetical protein